MTCLQCWARVSGLGGSNMPISLARLAELTWTGDSQLVELQTIHRFHNCVLGSITLCLGYLDCGVAEADCEAVLRAGPRGRGRGADVRRAREGGDRDGVAVQHRQVVTVPAVCSHTLHNNINYITLHIIYLSPGCLGIWEAQSQRTEG